MSQQRNRNGKKKILSQGRFLRFVIKDDWEYFERHNCEGIVIIVAMTDKREVIFVEQYRPPVDKQVIEFPAGLVNDFDPIKKKKVVRKKEGLAKAARRELLEETGYQAKSIRFLLEGPVSAGASSNLVTIVHASGLKKIAQGGGDETESIIVHAIPLEEVDAWLNSQARKGKLIEPKIYTGLYFIHNYNKSFGSKKV